MIDWQTLQFASIWPAWLVLPVTGLLVALWFFRRRGFFPDISLINETRRNKGFADRLLPTSSYAILIAFIIVLMGPSIVVIDRAERSARDFVMLVDTSRSMRHDTDARRDQFELNFVRRVGAFSDAVDDPDAIPHVARFELAREALFRFLMSRQAGDRVALVYFNDDAHPVSALTSNLGFVVDQLAIMDDYVNWGTDIAAAMNSSMNLLERYPDNNKRALVLMTDAETRYTQDLEQQLARLASTGLSFYLLWITTDTEDLATDDGSDFLALAKSVGTVITIKDPDPRNLQEALLDISRLEGYQYEEIQHRTVNLAEPLLNITRVAFMLWLLLIATIFHPTLSRRSFTVQSI